MLMGPQPLWACAFTSRPAAIPLVHGNSPGDWCLAVQFLAIIFVVGKEALRHLQAEQGPEEGGMLLLLAAASVIVLSALCGLKLDLSVSPSRPSHVILMCARGR